MTLRESYAPLDASRVDSNAQLIASAMEVDAAYRYLFPHDATRAAGLADFFARNQRVHLPYACTHVALGAGGELLGTVTLRPPGGIHISSLTMLRHGLLPFAMRHGRDAVRRLFWLKDTYEALEQQAARGEPHLYVHMMAVHPDLQGRGIGARLLGHVLERGMYEHPSARTVLTTHLARNVAFYRRAGFELTSEHLLRPPGGEPIRVWAMAREAGSASR